VNDDMGGNGIGKTELVCRRETDHQNSDLIAPRDGVDDRRVIGSGGFSGEAAHGGHVIESTIDAPDVVRPREPLKRLVDASAGAEVKKVHRRPDDEWLSRAHPAEDQGPQIESVSLAAPQATLEVDLVINKSLRRPVSMSESSPEGSRCRTYPGRPLTSIFSKLIRSAIWGGLC
jgi:hypothetical protein